MIRIVENVNCMGCYACVAICPIECITMESDYEGFWYPKVAEEKCIKCGKCIGVCPVLQYSSQNVSKIMEPVAYAQTS